MTRDKPTIRFGSQWFLLFKHSENDKNNIGLLILTDVKIQVIINLIVQIDYNSVHKDGNLARETEKTSWQSDITQHHFTTADIQKKAVEDYKNSYQFREDSCREVAENIAKLDTLHYLNKYIKSSTVSEYPALKAFYKDFIKSGEEQYKNKK